MPFSVPKLALVVVLSQWLSGCYYWQAAEGQWALSRARTPVSEVIADSDTEATVRQKLELASRALVFAHDELSLPDNGSYADYVALDRDYVVVNVFAAEEFSLTPKTWCYPIAGCLAYRGYFDADDAARKASRLRNQGFDVSTSKVPAYSTLGRFRDPIVSTMFRRSDEGLISLLFHELAHQQVYVRNDSAFNEAFAVAVEIEGVKKWFRSKGDTKALVEYERSRERQRDFLDLLDATRLALLDIYQSAENEAAKRAAKAMAIKTMRERYYRIRDGKWRGFDGYDGWFARPLNNAQLAASGIYNDLVPEFQSLFRACGEDFARFYAAAEKLTKRSPDERRAALKQPACS